MDTEAIYKALANPIRRQILQCLKEPERFISTEECGEWFKSWRMCRADRKNRGYFPINHVQSFISVATGRLIQVTKYGQWSYFSRNEALIQEFLQHLQHGL